MMMRPLTLHVSALNDAEYDLYTSAITDLVDDELNGPNGSPIVAHDDAYYESMTLGVREARAWLRGRYREVPTSEIDSILRFFHPGMGTNDTLTGGQFFAVLRLLLHVESGKQLDRSLAFVQAHPASLAKPPPPPSPPKPDRGTGHAPETTSNHNPFAPQAAGRQHNPFVRTNTHSQSIPSSAQTSGSSKQPPLPPRKPTTEYKPVVHSSPATNRSSFVPPPHHPPLARQRSRSPVKAPGLGDGASPLSAPPTTKPIAPPPKPPHVSALMRQSLQASKVAQSLKKAEEQLEQERVLQVLKSSSSVPQSMSAPRSSSPVGYTRNRSPSQSGSEGRAPPLPRRRTTSKKQASPPMSSTSLEQVALAGSTYSPFHVSPFRSAALPQSTSSGSTTSGSPPRQSVDLPPPTHPARKPSLPRSRSRPRAPSDGPLATNTDFNAEFDAEFKPRMSRSKSVHSVTSYPPPAPPPRRRRPESVQVFGGFEDSRESPFATPVSPNSGAPLSRHASMSIASSPASTRLRHGRQTSLSLSSSSEKAASSPFDNPARGHVHDSPMSNIQRTIASLQPKLDALQPRLEKARFKAEAGLSRRGFVRDLRRREGEDEEGLMGGGGYGSKKNSGEWSEEWERVGAVDSQETSVSLEDSDQEARDGTVRGRRQVDGHWRAADQDSLKLPAGEGWRPL